LAEAFSLLGRAILELPAPVPHEALRARMSALHGREDPLLDTGRFFKLLRQANDAEVADVKKLGEDNYEIAPNPTQVKRLKAQQREAAALAPATATPPASERAPDGEPAAPAAKTTPPALRFRRGSRSPSRSAELSLVGVVKIDEDPPAKPAKPAEKPSAEKDAKTTKATKRPRARKAAKSTKSSKAATTAGEASAPVAKATKSATKAAPRRARAKK
jgi:hypothetical protein